MKTKIIERRLKMEQKYILGIIALSMIAIFGISMVSAFGFGKGFDFLKPTLTDEERTQLQEQEQAIQTAVANNDYATWKSLVNEQIVKMQEQITEENFNKAVEQNEQMKVGQVEQKALQTALENKDYDTWKTLMEAKITEDNFNKVVEQFQKMNETKKEMNRTKEMPRGSLKAPQLSDNEKALQTAIENNDYDTWKTLMEAKITEDNFNKAVENYSNMKEQRGTNKISKGDNMRDMPRNNMQQSGERNGNRNMGLFGNLRN
jgi:hypothetical protein